MALLPNGELDFGPRTTASARSTQDLGALVDGAFRWCLERRLITRASVRDDGTGARILTVEFDGGRYRDFALHREELANGEIERWLEVVMREIGLEQTQDWRSGAARMAARAAAERIDEMARVMASGVVDRMTDSMLNHVLGIPSTDDAAEKKAEALFVQTAGQVARDELANGFGLQVKGSAGGDYVLHKKRSYCVTRVSDGAQLCAVVPGVPLWDHLLGIKLTIEHDEPEFLRKANVAGVERFITFYQGVSDPNARLDLNCRSVTMPAHIDVTAIDDAITQRRPG